MKTKPWIFLGILLAVGGAAIQHQVHRATLLGDRMEAQYRDLHSVLLQTGQAMSELDDQVGRLRSQNLGADGSLFRLQTNDLSLHLMYSARLACLESNQTLLAQSADHAELGARLALTNILELSASLATQRQVVSNILVLLQGQRGLLGQAKPNPGSPP